MAAALALLVARGAMAQKPVDLPGAHRHPESMAVTPDGTAYVGSVYYGGVLKVDLASGKVEQWIAPGTYGSGSTFGILVDPVNKLLWTCNNDISFTGVTIAGADKGVWLKGFDLTTRQGKVSLKLPGERPFCNDAAVARDGTLYVTDTNTSHILKWTPGSSALALWSADPALANAEGSGLDGIAFGSDGNLYVNNWKTNALLRVAVNADGSAGAVTKLATSRPVVVPDGLRPIGGMRFALAEGAGKISLVTVAGDKAEVTTLVDGLSSPTGVGYAKGIVWYVQGEVSYVLNPAKRALTPPLPFRVAPVKLP